MTNLNASTPQLQAVKSMADLLTSLNPDKLATLFSKDYQYEAFNGATDLAKMDREKHVGVVRALWAGMTKFDVTYHEVIEAPGKVILHATLLSQTTSGDALPYDILLIVSFGEEDGELKITSMKDFPDLQKRGAFIARVLKPAAESGSAS